MRAVYFSKDLMKIGCEKPSQASTIIEHKEPLWVFRGPNVSRLGLDRS